jgi:hypothetical protein
MEDFKMLKEKELKTYSDEQLAIVAGSIDGILMVIDEMNGLEEWERSIQFNSRPELRDMCNDQEFLSGISNKIRFIMLERMFGFEVSLN